MPFCCAHTRGGNRTQGAKQKAPLCTRTPTAPPVGGARPSSGGAHRAEQQANEQQTVPLCARTPTPHLSVGTSELRAAHIGPSNTAPSCARPNSHAPTFRRGTSELQGDVHRGPKAARSRGGARDAIDGGDDRSRKLFASMAPEGPGGKNNNMVVVGAGLPKHANNSFWEGGVGPPHGVKPHTLSSI